MSKNDVKIIGGNGNGERNRWDFYPTPPECTEARVRYLIGNGMIRKGDRVWEPACGEGAMLNELERLGLNAYGTDIQMGQDFRLYPWPEQEGEKVLGIKWIITNPPFALASDFINTAYFTNLPFAFLLKSQFWHSKKRLDLFRTMRPSHVLPLTWRPDFTGEGASLMDMIWVVWYGRPNKTIYEPLERPTKEEYVSTLL